MAKICRRDYCRLPTVNGQLCEQHLADKKQRQRYTAMLPKCPCGNCAKTDDHLCTRCREAGEQHERQRRRDEFIDSLMENGQ